MKEKTQTKPFIAHCKNADGSLAYDVVRCTSPSDLDCQPDIPIVALVLVTLSPILDGKLMWSPYTAERLRGLLRQFGDARLRSVLFSMLVDMKAGFKPSNPIGLFISRVTSATVSDVVVS